MAGEAGKGEKATLTSVVGVMVNFTSRGLHLTFNLPPINKFHQQLAPWISIIVSTVVPVNFAKISSQGYK